MTDISLSVKWALLKTEDGEHTQTVSSTGMTHVNVHPEVVFLADICYAVQWIERTLHCGPRCAANKERHCALRKKKQSEVRMPSHRIMAAVSLQPSLQGQNAVLLLYKTNTHDTQRRLHIQYFQHTSGG